MHFNAGNCNSMLLQGWGFYINSVSSRIALYLGRGIGALGSFIYAKRYSSWYGTSLLLTFCWCENWYLSHLFVNCTIHYLLIIMKSCLITHSVLLPYRFFTFMWFKLSICFLFAFFLLQNLLAHTLSSNKAWNPALYCINLTFCVLVKQNAEIWISAVGWNVISLWSSKMRLIICPIPSYSLIYLGQFFLFSLNFN